MFVAIFDYKNLLTRRVLDKDIATYSNFKSKTFAFITKQIISKKIEEDIMVNLLTIQPTSLGSLICNGIFDDNEMKPVQKTGI